MSESKVREVTQGAGVLRAATAERRAILRGEPQSASIRTVEAFNRSLTARPGSSGPSRRLAGEQCEANR